MHLVVLGNAKGSHLKPNIPCENIFIQQIVKRLVTVVKDGFFFHCKTQMAYTVPPVLCKTVYYRIVAQQTLVHDDMLH